jgi:hypothetical protein
MIVDTFDIDAATFAATTGWDITAEGACKGDVCVPLGGDFELESVADRLGMAIVTDDGVTALGPETIGGRALVTAQTPDLVLPDINGSEFQLSSLLGKKVLLVAWSPY